MNTTARQTAIGAAAVVLFLCTDLQSATAQAEMGPSPIQQMAGALNPMNWRLPQWNPQWKMPSFRAMLPGNDEKARIRKKKDGLFDEVTKTASNSWNKTKQALNPQKLNPIRFMPASARTPAPQRQPESKPGFFRSLFTPAPPPREDNTTVTDFLRQSRPSP